MRRSTNPAPRVPSLGRLAVLPLLLLLLAAAPAAAQFVFLDANGDGVNDASDQLNASGPTYLDVYFVTDRNQDGSPVACPSDPTQPLTINSYEFVLQALDGKVQFGPMLNRLPFSDTPASFAGYADTTNATVYHNGKGYRDNFPPGRYRVATLRVEILEGTPSLTFRGRSPLQPNDLTSFGTRCEGADFDNTHTLGEDFHDAAGIGGPHADAGGFYTSLVGLPIRFDGTRSSSPTQRPLTFSWAFDDGATAEGAVVSHAFQTDGEHTATLTVSDGTGSDTDAAQVVVTLPDQPVAITGGPYRGRIGIPVMFDGSRSYDPDGDPLSYAWTFGDGERATGAMPHHIYQADGVFEVLLIISNGTLQSSARTTATIHTPVNHAPAAHAGGPYTGYAGRWIQFDATRSSDPDGDFLWFTWEFGDGDQGSGIVTAHAYARAGTYVVKVTASDGLAEGAASATATIAATVAADAFLDGRKTVVDLDEPDDFVAVRFQPVQFSFAPIDVDGDRAVLTVLTSQGGTEVVAAAQPALQGDDSDHDGVPEFVALFPRESLRDLATRGLLLGRIHIELRCGLHRGGELGGSFEATFIHSNQFDLTVTPNPFNPIAHVVIRTKTPGAVSAKLYDVRGRHVKTILRGDPLPAGRHDVVFEARDDQGAQLASGLYFLQVRSADGSRTGRVVVAK